MHDGFQTIRVDQINSCSCDLFCKFLDARNAGHAVAFPQRLEVGAQYRSLLRLRAAQHPDAWGLEFTYGALLRGELHRVSVQFRLRNNAFSVSVEAPLNVLSAKYAVEDATLSVIFFETAFGKPLIREMREFWFSEALFYQQKLACTLSQFERASATSAAQKNSLLSIMSFFNEEIRREEGKLLAGEEDPCDTRGVGDLRQLPESCSKLIYNALCTQVLNSARFNSAPKSFARLGAAAAHPAGEATCRVTIRVVNLTGKSFAANLKVYEMLDLVGCVISKPVAVQLDAFSAAAWTVDAYSRHRFFYCVYECVAPASGLASPAETELRGGGAVDLFATSLSADDETFLSSSKQVRCIAEMLDGEKFAVVYLWRRSENRSSPSVFVLQNCARQDLDLRFSVTSDAASATNIVVRLFSCSEKRFAFCEGVGIASTTKQKLEARLQNLSAPEQEQLLDGIVEPSAKLSEHLFSEIVTRGSAVSFSSVSELTRLFAKALGGQREPALERALSAEESKRAVFYRTAGRGLRSESTSVLESRVVRAALPTRGVALPARGTTLFQRALLPPRSLLRYMPGDDEKNASQMQNFKTLVIKLCMCPEKYFVLLELDAQCVPTVNFDVAYVSAFASPETRVSLPVVMSVGEKNFAVSAYSSFSGANRNYSVLSFDVEVAEQLPLVVQNVLLSFSESLVSREDQRNFELASGVLCCEAVRVADKALHNVLRALQPSREAAVLAKFAHFLESGETNASLSFLQIFEHLPVASEELETYVSAKLSDLQQLYSAWTLQDRERLSAALAERAVAELQRIPELASEAALQQELAALRRAAQRLAAAGSGCESAHAISAAESVCTLHVHK